MAPSGDNSPGAVTLKFDRTTEGGAADFSDYDDPDVVEATETFTFTFFDHPKDTLNGSDVIPEVNLVTNPKTKGVYRWLAEQNTAIDIAGIFDGLAGNQAVVIKRNTASATSVPTPTIPLPPTTEVHFEDFESVVSSEWSSLITDTTPVGSRGFLGQFANDTASLILTGLPTHTQAKVTFDLFVIGLWDGNDITDGPDLWSLTADSGVPQINTTFSTTAAQQAFPGDVPSGDNPARTGAAEDDSLGFLPDSVYNLSFTFPHTANSLSLDFAGSGLDAGFESWGLDNGKVDIIN